MRSEIDIALADAAILVEDAATLEEIGALELLEGAVVAETVELALEGYHNWRPDWFTDDANPRVVTLQRELDDLDREQRASRYLERHGVRG